jgi:hypothetical protein
MKSMQLKMSIAAPIKMQIIVINIFFFMAPPIRQNKVYQWSGASLNSHWEYVLQLWRATE